MNALRSLLEQAIFRLRRISVKPQGQGFEVTQSTVSRDLTRLAAVKARDASGRVIYRLPDDNSSLPVLIPTSKVSSPTSNTTAI